jgi:hypothetical protein
MNLQNREEDEYDPSDNDIDFRGLDDNSIDVSFSSDEDIILDFDNSSDDNMDDTSDNEMIDQDENTEYIDEDNDDITYYSDSSDEKSYNDSDGKSENIEENEYYNSSEEDDDDDEDSIYNSTNITKKSVKQLKRIPKSEWSDNDKNVYILNEQDPTSLHIFTEKPYFYLTDYQSEFVPDFKITNNEPIKYYLYLYILCNNTNHDPYLSCLLEYDKKSTAYVFPEITYTPYNLKDNETHDVYIKNMCYNIIYPLFNIEESEVTEEFIEYTEDCFKGSLYNDGMKHGYIAFNADKFVHYLKGNYQNLSQYFHKDQTIPHYTWVCIDEISNKRVYNASIHVDVTDTFRQYQWLREIKNEKDEATEIPKMLYSCTIKKSKIDTSMKSIEKQRHLPPVTIEKNIGRVRYFVNELDESHELPFEVPRYIVFLGDVKIIDNIENDGDLIKSFQKERLRITSVEFKKNDRKIYGVFNGECIFKF